MRGDPRSIGRPPGLLPCGGRFGSARCTFGTGRRPDMPGKWSACRNQRFFLRDMNVDVLLADSRRIEGLANGLSLWQGAQVAIDTTFVSPVSSAGADRVPGKAAADARRRKRQTTYPELLAARRCRLVVLGGPAAWLPPRRVQRRPASGRQRGRQPATVERACWRWLRSGPWHGPSWNCHWIWRISAMARNRPWQTCWRTRARPSMCRPLMKRPQPAAQRWGPWNRLDMSSCRRKKPRTKQKNETRMALTQGKIHAKRLLTKR